MRWAEVHENRPWLSHLTLKYCVVCRSICLVGAHGTAHVLKCNLLIWGPNLWSNCLLNLVSLHTYVYVHINIHAHVYKYICTLIAASIYVLNMIST